MEEKHAYLITCHHNFEQLTLLLRLLDDVRNDIYIHVDSKAGECPAEKIRDSVRKSELFFVPRTDARWGGFSLTRAEYVLLSESIKRAHSYYHLLSGQDMPLKTQDEIHRFFEENAGKEFISIDGRADADRKILERVSLYRFLQESRGLFYGSASEPWKRGAYLFLSVLEKLSMAAQRALRVDRLKDASDLFYYGSNWCSVTHEMARYILSQRDWVRQYFRRSACSDELFVQTLAMRSPYKSRIAGKNMRLIDWTRAQRNSPHTFTMEDYGLLVSSDCLFARKFDEKTDMDVIRKLYRHIKSLQDG